MIPVGSPYDLFLDDTEVYRYMFNQIRVMVYNDNAISALLMIILYHDTICLPQYVI